MKISRVCGLSFGFCEFNLCIGAVVYVFVICAVFNYLDKRRIRIRLLCELDL